MFRFALYKTSKFWFHKHVTWVCRSYFLILMTKLKKKMLYVRPATQGKLTSFPHLSVSADSYSGCQILKPIKDKSARIAFLNMDTLSKTPPKSYFHKGLAQVNGDVPWAAPTQTSTSLNNKISINCNISLTLINTVTQRPKQTAGYSVPSNKVHMIFYPLNDFNYHNNKLIVNICDFTP